MHLPRRIVTILEGESLVNDASGLVLYKFAVAAAVTGVFSLPAALGQFVLVAAGGIAVGFALGRAAVVLHLRLKDPLIEILFSLALPYGAYLLAEQLHVSGVLSVVAAGLVRARHAPKVFGPESRILAHSMWNIVVFLMNCLIFILIGLELRVIATQLAPSHALGQVIGFGALLTLVVIAVRMIWVFPGAYLPRLALRAAGRRPEMPTWQSVTVVGWCGMRGIVSLAAALALPTTLADGSPFPGRDLAILLAFVVILLTLVLPGLTLAPLIRLLGVGGDWHAFEEQRLARTETARAGLRAVELLAREGEIEGSLAEHLRVEYEARLARHSPRGLLLAPEADPWRRARRASLAAERRALIELWHDGRIGDEVMHELERELDFAEARVRG
jgi:CPA1 family monovalent cation:H+ antiporter